VSLPFKGTKRIYQQVETLIAELKREIILGKSLRTQNKRLNFIDYSRPRVTQHIVLTCNKIISLKRYQHRECAFLVDLTEELLEGE
jgi:hypothetical protein